MMLLVVVPNPKEGQEAPDSTGCGATSPVFAAAILLGVSFHLV